MAFHALEKLINLQDGYKRAFKIAGQDVILVQENGRPYLLANTCPHMGVSLNSATLLPQGLIRCNAHGIEFDLESGRALGPLSSMLECLQKFELVYDGPNIGVDL